MRLPILNNCSQDEGSRLIDEVHSEVKEAIAHSNSEESKENESQCLFKDFNDRKSMFPDLSSARSKCSSKNNNFRIKRIQRILKTVYFDKNEKDNNYQNEIDYKSYYNNEGEDDPFELCDWIISVPDNTPKYLNAKWEQYYIIQNEFSSIKEVSCSEDENECNSESKSQTEFETSSNNNYKVVILHEYPCKHKDCDVNMNNTW